MLLLVPLLGCWLLSETADAAELSVREAPGRPKPATAETAARKSIAPLGPKAGVAGYQQSVVLPPLSAEVLQGLSQQDATETKRRVRIGVSRPFDQPIIVNSATVPAAEWTLLPDGWRIWSARVSSQGALGLRLHVESLALPAGVRLVAFDPAKPSPALAPITAESSAGQPEVWTEAIFSDTAVLECQVPPGVVPGAVSFSITGVSHLYRLAPAPAAAKVGACEHDVTCYPAWAQEAAGTARLMFVDGGTTYLCTGCLLAENAATQAADYLLTANHCIDRQSVALTLELFWFYQTSTCNGTPPDPLRVPQTFGADFLAGSRVNDFTFLQLRQASPDGVFYLGWTTASPTGGETLATIHHPDASYKRISFGNEVGTDGIFWEVEWFSGVTEPGSSGAPLFNANHQVIGQLYGGDSSCTNLTGLDTFGRFDLTYPAIKQWIDPGVPITSILTVITNGVGTVFPNYNGRALTNGQTYTMTARPGPGYVFADWSGAVSTNSPVLRFVMQDGLVLQANFIPSPFPAVKGTYYGLFSRPNAVSPDSSGAFTLAVTTRGTFSGSLQMVGARYPLSGGFDATGTGQTTIARRNQTSLSVGLQLDLTQGTDRVMGTVSDGTWTAELAGDRAVFDGRTNVPPQAGQYTLIIPGNATSTTEPGGDGYGTVTVDRFGRIRLSGSLADGTRFSENGTLSKYGQWPLYLSLYSNQGSIFSWITFANTAMADLSGNLTWFKPSMTTAKYYPAGFTTAATVSGSAYRPPAMGQRVLNFTDADLVLSGAALAQSITNVILLQTNNRVMNQSSNRLSLSFTLSSGSFRGTVVNPATLQSIAFGGVALQKVNLGRGYYLGTDQSGPVSLGR